LDVPNPPSAFGGPKADAEKDINETNMQSALKGLETEIEKDSGTK
jgi:hypothetical protein